MTSLACEQEKIVCIDEVFTHLEPCNEKLAESYCKTWSELHISADKIGVINLASTTMEADRKLYTGNLQLDIDPRYLDDIKIKDLERDNQKIHLLAWFIKVNLRNMVLHLYFSNISNHAEIFVLLISAVSDQQLGRAVLAMS